MVTINEQSAETRENVRRAKDLWDLRQAAKHKLRKENQEKRRKRTNQQQIKLLKQRRGQSLKEIERLNKDV